MTIKIEKNVSIPVSESQRRYPFGDMEITDSFAVPVGTRKVTAVRSAVITSLSKYNTRATKNGGTKVKLTSRVETDANNNPVAVRFWRIEGEE